MTVIVVVDCPSCGELRVPARSGWLERPVDGPARFGWPCRCGSTVTCTVTSGPTVLRLSAAGVHTVDPADVERTVAEFHRRLADDRWVRTFVSACVREARP